MQKYITNPDCWHDNLCTVPETNMSCNPMQAGGTESVVTQRKAIEGVNDLYPLKMFLEVDVFGTVIR